MCAHLDQFVGRVVRVKPILPESFVVPEVFTDGHTHLAVVYGKQAAFARGLEVARVVENVVFRQQGFVGKSNQLLIVNYGSGVIEVTAGSQIDGPDGPNNCC